jgi:L-iditol 2-dehydrogenase
LQNGYVFIYGERATIEGDHVSTTPAEAPAMRAARLTAAEQVDIVRLPRPTPGPGDIVIRVAAAGICGSDLHAWHGHHPFRRPPVILGHEVSGTIVSVGEGVASERMGERVVVEPQRICGQCDHCRAGRNELCVNRVLPGMAGWDGCIADFFTAPASMAHSIPESLDLVVAALAEPLAVAVHALRRGGVESGDRVNVIGAGPIGALVTSVATQRGAQVGIVTDIDAQKLDFVRSLGARVPVDVSDGDLWVRDLAAEDLLADVTVVAATAPNSVVEATALTKAGGTIVLLGLYGGRATFDASRLVTQEQSIVASVTYDSSDFRTAVELLNRNVELFARLITSRITLDDLEDEFRAQSARSRFAMKTLIVPSAGQAAADA